MSTIMAAHREDARGHKDPLSQEFIVLEDARRSMRFERESPNPVWWWDYTAEQRGALGSAIRPEETPDVLMRRPRWERMPDGGMATELSLLTEATVPGYAIAVWGLPEFDRARHRLWSDADSVDLVWNAGGESDRNGTRKWLSSQADEPPHIDSTRAGGCRCKSKAEAR